MDPIELVAVISVFVFLGIFAVLYLGTIFKFLDHVVPKPRPRPAIDLEAESIEEEISQQARHREEMLDRIVGVAVKNPEKIASIINTWLIRNGYSSAGNAGV